MFARVVRFHGVTEETIAKVKSEVESGDGPPPGVNATSMKMLYDADQGTSLFIGFFETREDMDAADAVFEAMDPGDTPGTRESVDHCEVVIEAEAG